jgi:hypothetical protein
MRIIQGLGIFLLCVGISSVQVQNNNTQYAYQIGVLKYRGGGDYYANPTSLPNLVQYANKNKNTRINPETPYVDVGSPDLFNYPFVHMTGHGNVVFSPSDIQNLRNYLLGGGFLHIDDNYGLDQFIRPEITKIFPDNKLVELPYNHEIFEYPYSFPKGIPKIHDHDNKPPQAFAIFENGRMCLLYTFETDLGDGWEDETVHNNTPENREKALKMGVNILYFALVKGGYERNQ